MLEWRKLDHIGPQGWGGGAGPAEGRRSRARAQVCISRQSGHTTSAIAFPSKPTSELGERNEVRSGAMWRTGRFDWNFSSTAEAATGILLLSAVIVAFF